MKKAANVSGRFYKITGPNGEAVNGGAGCWPLPKNGEPGAWTRKQTPSLCISGWHVIPASSIHGWWRDGCVLWEAEGRGKSSVSYEETAFESARLVRRVGTLTPEIKKAYEEARATALKAYVEATATAWKAHVEATATALKAYVEATATAWKAHVEATATAWKAYEEATAPALKTYEEATAPALKAYVAEGEAAVEGIFGGEK